MYASARLFSIRSQIRAAAGLAVSVGACTLLNGCVANPFGDAQVDPRSPVAAEVARVANSTKPYPTFASIPPVPKDVRAPAQYGRQVRAIDAARDDLMAKTAPETWELTNTEAFAAGARRDAGQEAAPSDTGATAAFATTQRKRATPPPPPPK